MYQIAFRSGSLLEPPTLISGVLEVDMFVDKAGISRFRVGHGGHAIFYHLCQPDVRENNPLWSNDPLSQEMPPLYIFYFNM